jgi:hypothetical protein
MGRAIVKTRMTPARTKSRFRWRARRDDRIRLGHHDVAAPRGRCAAQNHRPSSPCGIRTPYPKWASCSHTPQRRAVSLTGATTSAIAGFIVLSSGSHFASASPGPDALSPPDGENPTGRRRDRPFREELSQSKLHLLPTVRPALWRTYVLTSAIGAR